MENTLFIPITIGTLQLPNRFVRSATNAYMADSSGSLTQEEIDLYGELARHEVGLIITGHAFVRADGRASPGMIGIDTDEKISLFQQAADTVHRAGNSKLVVQINHGGAQVSRPEGTPEELLAPAAREDVPEARPFTEGEAEALISAYIEAAVRAHKAGADGVQLHAAHGYFLNQTLSPKTNTRQDKFGGPIEKRTRFVREIIAGIRNRLGPDFPILMKLACRDGFPGGLSLEDSLEAAAIAEDAGLDGIEISGGMRKAFNMRKPKTVDDEGFFLKETEAFKRKLSIPVITVHGYRTLSKMAEIIETGKADLISLCRPLIREPDLIEKFQTGTKQSADCISCNLCLKNKEALRCWDKEY
jgi:2,4-dienoyl-CoA reductase-like NADH-dependent reductase (Old Yellow Enzyme family)